MKTVAIIMPAKGTPPEWIMQSLEGISELTSRPGWYYDLRIGIDGDPALSQFLTDSGIAHHYSPESVGPYVLRNSLVALADCDAIAPIDSDDIVQPEYLNRLLDRIERSGGIAGSGRTSISSSGDILETFIPYHSGVAVFSRHAWDKLGGYRAYPFAADSEMIQRAHALRIPVFRIWEALYFRRVHPESLSHSPATGRWSRIREELWAEMKALPNERIEPVTVPLEMRSA